MAAIGFALGLALAQRPLPGGAPSTGALLGEESGHLLLESGDLLLME